MVRGISFQIPNKYGSILNEILDNVDVEGFNWYNIQDQNQVLNLNDNPLFNKEQYSGKDFKYIINQKDYYILFIKLQAILGNKFEPINNYSDFLKSDSQILLLIYDSVYVEIYIKDQYIATVIKNNAERYHFMNIEYICDDNDYRTNFNLL